MTDLLRELVEFLRPCLDEDEQAARAASPSPWKDPEEDEAVSLWLTREDAYHIYRWEPARVLREVEADRKLIAAYLDIRRRQQENSQKFARMMRDPAAHAEDLPAVKTHGWELRGREEGLRYALMTRAERFADHPDYREEWRP